MMRRLDKVLRSDLSAIQLLIYGTVRDMLASRAPRIATVLENIKNRPTRLCTSNTALVIEGYPRSGNSSLAYLARILIGHGRHIATHIHRPIAINIAIQLSRPCLTCFRRPEQAIVSRLALFIQGRIKAGLPSEMSRTAQRLLLTQYLRDWIGFYREVERRLDRIYLISLEDFARDPKLAVELIRHLCRIHSSPDRVEEELSGFWKCAWHVGPDEFRGKIKEDLMVVYSSLPIQKRSEADALYENLLSASQRQNNIIRARSWH